MTAVFPVSISQPKVINGLYILTDLDGDGTPKFTNIKRTHHI